MTQNIAYLAGLFDGEGSICISRYHRKDTPYLAYSLFINVRNTEKELVHCFQRAFGGCVGESQQTGIGTQPIYWWSCSKRRAIEFLDAVYPYLKSTRKRKAVRIARTFQAQKMVGAGSQNDAYRARQERYHRQMQFLYYPTEGSNTSED